MAALGTAISNLESKLNVCPSPTLTTDGKIIDEPASRALNAIFENRTIAEQHASVSTPKKNR